MLSRLSDMELKLARTIGLLLTHGENLSENKGSSELLKMTVTLIQMFGGVSMLKPLLKISSSETFLSLLNLSLTLT